MSASAAGADAEPARRVWPHAVQRQPPFGPHDDRVQDREPTGTQKFGEVGWFVHRHPSARRVASSAPRPRLFRAAPWPGWGRLPEARHPMSYGVVHQFKGGTKDQYEASIAAVHPSDGSLPAGQIFHAAGPSADGWTIVALHETKESWETFRDGILMPRMQEGIPGGFSEPPQETVFEVVNEVKAPAPA